MKPEERDLLNIAIDVVVPRVVVEIGCSDEAVTEHDIKLIREAVVGIVFSACLPESGVCDPIAEVRLRNMFPLDWCTGRHFTRDVKLPQWFGGWDRIEELTSTALQALNAGRIGSTTVSERAETVTWALINSSVFRAAFDHVGVFHGWADEAIPDVSCKRFISVIRLAHGEFKNHALLNVAAATVAFLESAGLLNP